VFHPPSFTTTSRIRRAYGTLSVSESRRSSSRLNPDLRGTGDGVRQMLVAYMRYWREHPRAFRFQLWRVLGAPTDERKARSKQLNQLFVPEVKAAQDAGHVRSDVPAGLLMITMGGLIQYFLHSDVETNDALAVTGAHPMTDDQTLDYLWDLVSAVPPSAPVRTSKRRASTKGNPYHGVTS